MLLNSDNQVNIIFSIFAKILMLFVRSIVVGAQKIDNTILNTYKIVVAIFLVTNKVNQVRFFKKTFLVANVTLEVVFEMLFFTLSGVNIDFLD